MGQYCKTALCYPQCMNGGFCTAPAVCSCPKGYQGRHCEGGKFNTISFAKKLKPIIMFFSHSKIYLKKLSFYLHTHLFIN